MILHHREDHWQFAIATEGRNIVLASLIDPSLDASQARECVEQELAMTHGVRLRTAWTPSRSPGSWRADLRPIVQGT